MFHCHGALNVPLPEQLGLRHFDAGRVLYRLLSTTQVAMIQLRTLGTIDLFDDSGARVEALLKRPKRLALLAYMATARPDTSYRREKLLALFWPEMDEQRARGSLRQSVHVLRQQLGASAVTALGDEVLSLAPAAVQCDSVEFERALGEGRLSDAVNLYGGDFLPGFFLDGAPDVDEWIESERTRLCRRAVEAAVSLADHSWTAGDYAECAQMARRAIGIMPADERAARHLIASLDRLGDRGAAIGAFDALAQRLDADFGVRPSAETQAVIAAVRTRDQPTNPTAAVRRPDGHSATRVPSLPLAGDDAVDSHPNAQPTRDTARLGRVLSRCAMVACVFLLSGSRPRTPTAGALPTIPAEARAEYSRARFYLAKPTEANLRRAVLLFEHALDAEPLYAPAYAGLGDAYLRLGYGSYLAPSDAFPKALAAAKHAIDLDSLAPEAHATLAFARMYYQWDWAGAEREFRRATRLAPDYALAHDWYAYLLTAQGRVAEARRERDIALRLAPLSVAIAVDAGFVSFYAGDLADAHRRLESALLMAPEVPAAHLWLARLYQREGNLERARAEFESSGELRSWVPTISGAAYVEASMGNAPAARAALARLDSLERTQYVTSYARALVHAALGERDVAFRLLDRAVDERTHWLVWLNRDTRWLPIRGDPRFEAVLRKMSASVSLQPR